MPTTTQINEWIDTIRQRYERYLATSFYFKDEGLRESFKDALAAYDLSKAPIPEPPHNFKKGVDARDLAAEDGVFGHQSGDLVPAFLIDENGGFDGKLYAHQESAIRRSFTDKQNVVVATGTASGKTESFLYPILFELYRQHRERELTNPGVRALILYPMNALANDQRERLGKICQRLEVEKSDFAPTFGQYIGQTPENECDKYRHAKRRDTQTNYGSAIRAHAFTRAILATSVRATTAQGAWCGLTARGCLKTTTKRYMEAKICRQNLTPKSIPLRLVPMRLANIKRILKTGTKTNPFTFSVLLLPLR